MGLCWDPLLDSQPDPLLDLLPAPRSDSLGLLPDPLLSSNFSFFLCELGPSPSLSTALNLQSFSFSLSSFPCDLHPPYLHPRTHLCFHSHLVLVLRSTRPSAKVIKKIVITIFHNENSEEFIKNLNLTLTLDEKLIK